MALLPILNTNDRDLSMIQTRWASLLNPVLSNPLNKISILKEISLTTGVNVINHRLGRMQQGWFITDIDGSSTIYRSAPLNDLTLTLTASAPATVSIGVF